MRPSLGRLSSKTFQTLKSAPLLFFGLQFLEGLSSVIAKLLETRFESNPVLAVVLFFPVFCIASTLSNALTFTKIRGETLSTIWPYFGQLVLASLTLGLVFILGFAALILPAFYFMAIYLFVPQVILSEQPGMSLSLGLFRSTKIAKAAFKTCVLTAIGALGIAFLTFMISESLGRWAGGVTENPFLRHSISIGIDAFLSMSTGAIIDVWVCHLFLELGKSE